MNVPKILRKTFLLLLLSPILAASGLYAQPPVYPVQLHVQLLPPYTPCLADYVTGDFTRLRVIALQRDMSKPDYRFSLKFTVKQGNRVVLQTNPFQINYDNEFTVRPGMATTISGKQLENTFKSINHPKSGENLCLPEGYYELVFQAFDAYHTSLPVSDLASTFVYFQKGLPPFLIAPADGDCIQENSALVSFTWAEQVIAPRSDKRYLLEIYEDNGAVSPQHIHQSQLPVISVNNLVVPAYFLPVTAAGIHSGNVWGDTLAANKRYLWRVKAYHAGSEMQNDAALANSGYSELRSFSFGKCVNVFAPQPQTPQKQYTTDKPELLRIDTTHFSAQAVWKNEVKYDYFLIEYRRNDSLMERSWVSFQAPKRGISDLAEDTLLLNGINRQTDYEVRVQGVFADGKYSLYSDTLQFRIAKEEAPTDCGKPVPALNSNEDIKLI